MADEQFYEKQIGAAYWYATHKQMIKSIIQIILFVLIFLLLAYNLFLLIFNLGLYGRKYSDFLTSLTTTSSDYASLRASELPQPIALGTFDILPNGSNFDIIAPISNPNDKWYATFKYQFQIGDNTTDLRPGFILPGESKNIIDLNVPNGDQASNILFEDLKWVKQINFPEISRDKFQVEIKNINLLPPSQLGIGEKVPISRLTFDVVNNSDYNYADMALQIYLLSGGQNSAVNQIHSGSLSSGQIKSYEVNFFGVLPKITATSIIPEINILDPSVFLKF